MSFRDFTQDMVKHSGRTIIAKLNLANGQACADIGLASLPENTGCMLRLFDSVGRSAEGWIGEAGEQVESFGPEKVLNGGMEAPYTGGVAQHWLASGTPTQELVDVYAGESSQKIVAISGASSKSIKYPYTKGLSLPFGELTRFRYATKILANKMDSVVITNGPSTQVAYARSNLTNPAWELTTAYFTNMLTVQNNNCNIFFNWGWYSSGSALIDAVSVQLVTAMGPTGVRITTECGGSQYSWVNIHPAFNPNDPLGLSYDIIQDYSDQYQPWMRKHASAQDYYRHLLAGGVQ